MHTPRVPTSFPITAHAVVAPTGAGVDPWAAGEPLARAMQAIATPWDRARRRWGASRIAVVFARDKGGEGPHVAAEGIGGDRSPSFTVLEGGSSAGEAIGWAHRTLHARRWDAVLLVGAGPVGLAVLLLERQGLAACTSLGVLSPTTDEAVLRAAGNPDWILGNGGAPWLPARHVRRVHLVPEGGASLVLELATVAAVLESGRPPAGVSFDAAGAPDGDAELVWVVRADETTTHIAPIRFCV